MTAIDRDRRHRWAETCERLAARVRLGWHNDKMSDAADLREIAAYLRAPRAREDAATKEEG